MEISLIFCTLAFILAGITQGALGFGSGIVGVPAGVATLGNDIVSPIFSITNLIQNSVVAFIYRKHYNFKKFGLLTIFVLIGTAIGAIIVNYINKHYLNIFVGIIVIIAIPILLYDFKLTIHSKKKYLIAQIPTGLASGVLAGSINLGSPPLTLFLTNQKEPKNNFKSAISTTFAISNILNVTIKISQGIFNKNAPTWQHFPLLFGALMLGFVIGLLVSKYINEKLFRTLILISILISAITSIVNGIIGLL